MLATLCIAACSFLAADEEVAVRVAAVRTELVIGEPLVLCVQVQNVSDRRLQLSRERALSALIFVREKGTADFELAARGAHFREGFEVDGTDAWPPKMQWAWDEWIVRRCDAEGRPLGLLFDRPGEYEIKVAVRLDHRSMNSRGWQETEVISIQVAPRKDAAGRELPTPEREVLRVLHEGIRRERWRDDVGLLDKLEGELAHYGQFRIGEFYYFACTGWPRLSDDRQAELESAESTATNSIMAFAKVGDRCPGLRRRAVFRTTYLLLDYPSARTLVDFEGLLAAAEFTIPLPHQPLDRFNVDWLKKSLRRLQILFVRDKRLDARVIGTFGNDLTWESFWEKAARPAGVAVRLPALARSSPFQDLGAVDTTLRDLLFRFSFTNQWWVYENGVVTYAQDDNPK